MELADQSGFPDGQHRLHHAVVDYMQLEDDAKPSWGTKCRRTPAAWLHWLVFDIVEQWQPPARDWMPYAHIFNNQDQSRTAFRP